MTCRKKQEQKSINKTEWNFVIVWQILHYTTETEIIVLAKNIRLMYYMIISWDIWF